MTQLNHSDMTDANGDGKMEPESAEPEAVEPEITRFDDTGDLRLILYKQASEQDASKVFVFIVSSKAMSMACAAWNSMLNGKFKEAQTTFGEREVELPEDDPAALEILLNIAHLRFELVPSCLDFHVLLSLAILTDKYDMTLLTRPWAHKWINGTQVTATQPGYEEWFWLAWEFGQSRTFEYLAAHLVKTVHLDNDGRCRTSSGKLLEPCGSPQRPLPPDIIERIMDVRVKVIADVLEIYYSALEELAALRMEESTTRCKGCRRDSDNRIQCDEMAFGSLSLALRKAGLGFQRVEASTMVKSVTDLLVDLRKETVRVYHKSSTLNYSTDECVNYSIQGDLLKKAQSVVENTPSPVTKVHRNHLARQQQKLGF